ncbi:MAG TPA: hypothetical protein VKR56_03660 [Candidatus Cybelea sp.]|nr:hypothetical protein [Candidatus Cybelea sp.]
MKIPTTAASALCVLLAGAILSGCSGTSVPSVGGGEHASSVKHRVSYLQPWSPHASVIPPGLRPTRGSELVRHLQGTVRHNVEHLQAQGIYASEFYGTSIFGYTDPNQNNNPYTCSESPVSEVNDIDTDSKGNLMDPDGGTGTVIVYPGPSLCGNPLPGFSDPFGQPSDAASVDATTDTIAVANIFDVSGAPGSIAVCALAGTPNCPTNLTNAAMNEVLGVAMDFNGNCYASALNSSGAPTLTYFAGCAGPGVEATGYGVTTEGGIDVDNYGHLVALDAAAGGTGALYVYSGCKPACTLAGGPFPLHGEAVYGHFGKNGSGQFVTGDFADGEIDVYQYTDNIKTHKITLKYKYSFNNGLTEADEVLGAALPGPHATPSPPPPESFPTEIMNYWAADPSPTPPAPTDIDLSFTGNVTAALSSELPLFGVYDAFCPPNTTCNPTVSFDPTSNLTTFTLSGSTLYTGNSYYANDSHFAVMYGSLSIPNLPCFNAAAQWSFQSAPPEPVAWVSMNADGCTPAAVITPNNQAWKYAVVYFESSFAPITPGNPATTGQWFAIPYHPGGGQPDFPVTNGGSQTVYTANSGIILNLPVPSSPDCAQFQGCPENLAILEQLNYTAYPPPHFKGSKFRKMTYPPPKVIYPSGGSR